MLKEATMEKKKTITVEDSIYDAEGKLTRKTLKELKQTVDELISFYGEAALIRIDPAGGGFPDFSITYERLETDKECEQRLTTLKKKVEKKKEEKEKKKQNELKELARLKNKYGC